MRVALIGAGATGARAARQLAATDSVRHLLISDRRRDRSAASVRMVESLGVTAEIIEAGEVASADVVLLALPSGEHGRLARQALSQGSHVVSVSDSVRDVRSLLELDSKARERGLIVAVGASFSPGLTCVLARHAATDFDQVDEIHVAKFGTGGPACARQHHSALGGSAVDWRDGEWVRRPGRSGRELVWFPDPVGAADCYRGALAEALLLVSQFPGVQRVTARVAATRRDRLSARLPMLRPPHPEGGVGAVRVEVRGRQAMSASVKVLGAMDPPAVAAATVAAVTTSWIGEGRLHAPGAHGLAAMVDPVPFLAALARQGLRAEVFEGVQA